MTNYRSPSTPVEEDHNQPRVESCESHELDSLELDDAKAILMQIGFFAEDTRFLSLRLSRAEFDDIALLSTVVSGTLEGNIARACRELYCQVTK